MSNEKINVKQLKIMVETNNEKEPFPLTFSKIYNPIESRVPANVEMSEYPYFTADVPYPEGVLEKKEYSELLRVFFDKNEFVEVIVKPYRSQKGGAPKSKDINQINKNIMTMLFLLFPTNYPSYGNIESSYDKYLLKKSSEFKFSVDQVRTAFSSSEQINEDVKREYSYLKLPNGICTISEVVWLNDVLNEPVYRELVDKLIEYNEWAEERKETLQADITKSINVLTEGLQKKEDSTTSTEDDKQKLEKQIESSFRITDDELNRVKKQVQIFTKENLETEMKTIFDAFFVVDDDKESVYQKYKTILFDNFFQKLDRINQEREFKRYFDFNIKDDNSKYYDFFQLHKAYSVSEDNKDKIQQLQNWQSLNDKQMKDANIYDYLSIDQIDKIIEKLNTYLTEITQAYNTDADNFSRYITNFRDANPPYISINKDGNKIDVQILKITNLTKLRSSGNNEAKFLQIEKQFKDEINKIQEIKTKKEDLLERLNIPAPAIFNMNNITMKKGSFDEKTEAIVDEINTKTFNLFTFEKDSLPDNSKSLNEIKNDLGANNKHIDKLKTLLYKSFEKYTKSLSFTQNSRLMFEKKEIDNNIEKMTKAILELNSVKNNINEIINLTESIQNFFNKIKSSGQISGLSTIELKIARIMKLSNEIKAFKLIQDNILSDDNTKGLFVYYEKEFAGDENTKRIFFDELRKEKYSVFTNTVAYIQKTFLQNNRQSMNPELQKMMNQYFQNTSADFDTYLIDPADKLINIGTQPDFSDLWNVSVTSKKTSNESSEPEYEIFVYMEVIQGELNPANKGMVKCDYLDEKLTILFDRLTSRRNQFEIIRTKPFSIEETIEKQKKKEAESIQEIAEAKSKIESASAKEGLPQAVPVVNPLENPLQIPIAEAVRIGGKKRRSTRRRYKRRNYYYTVRKH